MNSDPEPMYDLYTKIQEKLMAKKKSSLSSAAKTLGKAGVKKGGPARAKKLSAGQRSAIAKKGGKARHKKE